MERLGQSLSGIFKYVASAAVALAIAIPLLTSASGQAEAAVMNQGPTSLVLNQLKTDGYKPVGAGITTLQGDQDGLQVFWKNEKNDWIATIGNGMTMQVNARGTNLEIKKWAYTLNASSKSVSTSSAGDQCIPFDQAKEMVLKEQFAQAVLIQGSLGKGLTMQTYVKDGKWLAVVVRPDTARTTCGMKAGHGFEFSDTSKIILSN